LGQRYRSVEALRSQEIMMSCNEAEKFGLPYIKERDIKVLKMQYNRCFDDAETQVERDMESYVKKEMRKYHRSSESFRDRCVIEKLCAENR
jgi:hypothetical protein